MKRAFFLSLLALTTGLIVSSNFSCTKSYDSTGAPTKQSLNQLFSDLKSTPEHFEVTAGIDTLITGQGGTKLRFYPTSFKDASGQIITSGKVDVDLVEMYKFGDMIANRATTTTKGGMLMSGGQLFISATQNGQQVSANKYGVAFKQGAASAQEMQLFYGNTNNIDSVVKWEEHHDTAAQNGTTSSGTSSDNYNFNVLNNGHYYCFDTCFKFSWINCDFLWDTAHGQLTTVSAVLPDTSFSPANTQLYLIIHDSRSIILLRGEYDVTTNTVSLNDDGNKIPVGKQYTIVGIAKKQEQHLYYSEKSGISVPTQKDTLTFKQSTLQEVKNKLAGL